MATKRKNNAKQRALKLKKSHVVASVICLLFVLIIVTIIEVIAFASFEAHMEFSTSENGIRRAVNAAELYDAMTSDGKEFDKAVFDKTVSDYRVIDKDGNIIYSNGDKGYIDDGGRPIMNLGTVDYGYKIKVYRDTTIGFLPPTLDNEYEIDAQSIDVFDNIMSNLDLKDGVDISFWVSLEGLKDGSTMIYRSQVMVTSTDLIFMVVFTVIIALIILLMTIILIANFISGIVNQRKMKKLLFMDPVSNDHNWIRFIIDGEELLGKRFNAKNTYAVVNLVFIKYRSYVLCHSVEEGEELLTKVYQTIRENVGKKDIVARTSSSFPMILRYTDENEVRMKIQSIISKLEKIDPAHKFTFQAGIDFVPASDGRRKDVHLERYYNNACSARITLSDSGESGIAVFDKKLLNDQKWIDKITEMQQAAIDNEDFLVYYQPKYDPRTNVLAGAEALIRWKTKDGLIPPGKFIPVFEDSGFITEIDHYMIRHVARDQKQWTDRGLNCVPVSVNVSRAHFVEPDLAEQIRDIVDSEGCPHNLIEIELTESAFFDDKDALLNTIGRLQTYGFTVSMDDFGSGYSSLNSLKDLPLNVLKLDAGFFRGSDDPEREHIVVAEAIRLAKSLNMKTVAEGVEEKDQVDFLASEGCDMIQGFYYARPMPSDDYEIRMAGGTDPDMEGTGSASDVSTQEEIRTETENTNSDATDKTDAKDEETTTEPASEENN